MILSAGHTEFNAGRLLEEERGLLRLGVRFSLVLAHILGRPVVLATLGRAAGGRRREAARGGLGWRVPLDTVLGHTEGLEDIGLTQEILESLLCLSPAVVRSTQRNPRAMPHRGQRVNVAIPCTVDTAGGGLTFAASASSRSFFWRAISASRSCFAARFSSRSRI